MRGTLRPLLVEMWSTLVQFYLGFLALRSTTLYPFYSNPSGRQEIVTQNNARSSQLREGF